MSKLSLYYEAQPFHVNQGWGILDALYKAFGFSRHNGIDIAHGHNSRLRAPFPWAFHRTIWQPNGGGLVLTIISKFEYDAPDGKPAHVMLDLMHLARYVITGGSGDIGELLCIAGNTGRSTGPHTHLQYRWVRRKGNLWVDVEKNDANNSFDPMPYYNGMYAVDYKAPSDPVLVETDPEVDLVPALEAVKVGLETIEYAPEPARPVLLKLFKSLVDLISRALTKG